MNCDGLRPYAREAETCCECMVFTARALELGEPTVESALMLDRALRELPLPIQLWCGKEAARRFRVRYRSDKGEG